MFFRRRIDTVDQVRERLNVDAPPDEVETKRKAFNKAASKFMIHSDWIDPTGFNFDGLTVIVYRGGQNAVMVRIQAPDGDRNKLIWLNGLVVVACSDPDSREKPVRISSLMLEDTAPESRMQFGVNFFGRLAFIAQKWGNCVLELRFPTH